MEMMFMLVMIAGGGCWAYRQWKALQPPGTQIMLPPGQVPPEQWQVIQPPKKAGLNKYVVMLLCFLYVICPLDIVPDVLPVLGWGDDLTAAVIGMRSLFKR